MPTCLCSLGSILWDIFKSSKWSEKDHLENLGRCLNSNLHLTRKDYRIILRQQRDHFREGGGAVAEYPKFRYFWPKYHPANFNCKINDFPAHSVHPILSGLSIRASYWVYYIEDITRWREDMNFTFEWQNSSRVRYCSCHENIKFISLS